MRTLTATLCTIGLLVSSSIALAAPDFSVGPQYDTTHVYVAPGDFDRFIGSFVATFGGSLSKRGVFTVTPTPSQTMSQLALTPAGTISVFGFKTPVPYPFGSERTGYLVKDFQAAIVSARANGADVAVSPFPDPIGRDAVITWPGGVNMQIYWHTTAPNYPALATIPENRVYVSSDRVDLFVRDFLAFAHGKVVSDDKSAPGVEIGKPGETYRRIRIQSGYGRMVVSVTNGQLPFPYGRELTGYEVADLDATLSRAQNAGATILVSRFVSQHRASAMVQFPGGYIAEIHAAASGPDSPVSAPSQQMVQLENQGIGRDDLVRWQTAWNSHDIDQVAALFSSDVVIHQPSNPKPLRLADARKFFGMIFTAYPDFHIDVVDSVIEGQKAVTIERVTGTWSGPYTDPASGATTPGNGKKFDHPGVMVIIYKPDHKIASLDIYWDRLVVDQQLGVSP